MRRLFLPFLACAVLAALVGCARNHEGKTDQPDAAKTAELAPAATPAAAVAPANIVKPKAEAALSMPVYPPESRKAREEGTVELNLHVLSDGSIDEVGVLKSSGFPRLDEYAVREARVNWRLKPGTVNGEPTAMWHNFRVTFRLSE